MEINAIMPRIPSSVGGEKAQEMEQDTEKVNEAEPPKGEPQKTDGTEGAEDCMMKDSRRFDIFEKSRDNFEPDMAGIYQGHKAVQENEDKEVSESKCTVNTDKVDAEIKQLQQEAQEINRQLQAEKNEDKRDELEQRLQRVESELKVKDNDNYRKQNAVYTYG